MLLLSPGQCICPYLAGHPWDQEGATGLQKREVESPRE